MKDLIKIYKSLLELYGPQGWWPLLSRAKIKSYDSATLEDKGYHCGDYSFPKNSRQRFEICIGALLTQNTAWTNVEKALLNLYDRKLLSPDKINVSDLIELKNAIKPAGYYNQKSEYIKKFSIFYISLKGKIPSRKELLSVKGIGPETADSILLYAYNQPEFVVDAYTKRMFSQLGFFQSNAKYHEVKEIFENNLPEDIFIYQEYHALIVQHAKVKFSRKIKNSLQP